MSYAYEPPLNTHAGESSGTRRLKLWPESSYISELCVSEQRRIWRVCADSPELSLLNNAILNF